MTTIAASKVEIACDQQASHASGLKLKVETKIHEIFNPLIYPKPFYIGYAGDLESCHSVLEWFHSPTEKPPRTRNAECVILTKDKKIFTFANPSKWIEVKEPFYAIGSGSQYALGAMYAGKTPKESVIISSKLDTGTGMGVRVFNFK